MDTVLYIVLTIVGLMVTMQLYIRLASWLKRGKTVSGIKGEIGKEIDKGKKVLVYFLRPAVPPANR